MLLNDRELTEKRISSGANRGEKNVLTVAQLEQQVNASKAREATGLLPGECKCVIQQGNVFSVDALWDCWVTPLLKGTFESLHWAASSLDELVTTGRAHYAIDLLAMSQRSDHQKMKT